MRNRIIINITLVIFSITINHSLYAYEVASKITDREILERLTRFEEGQKSLKTEIVSNAGAINQLRNDMNLQFERMDSQFNRSSNMMLGILGVFATLVGAIIWFALWDRRSMIRPFEDKTTNIENQISTNRTKLHTLVEAFRALSKSDEKVEAILKKFNLL